MSIPSSPRIALIHATPLSISAIADAMARGWPEAETFNVLEDALSRDRSRIPSGDPRMVDRFVALSAYAQRAGAEAILYTCSAFGPEIEAARRAVPLPTLKPNEAMFDEALACGGRIALLGTFEGSLAPMGAELAEAARALGVPLELQSVHVPQAFDALGRGDAVAHDLAIAAAAAHVRDADVICLAQFSMARALASAQAAAGRIPVLTSPDSAVRALRAALGSAA